MAPATPEPPEDSMTNLPGNDVDFDAEEAAAEAAGRRIDRRPLLLALLGVAAAMAVVVWFAVSATHGRVSWQTTGYDVVDAQRVDVRFTVHRPADVAVTCQLKAMDQAFAAVGLLDVTIPAGPEVDVAQRATIRTTALAVTGTVLTCKPA
ncbi:DUF4307 domain-containing protein [Nostocoides vanveenii]|uniref:DUF4307 domain-containing protein n=1 Tax=Nostocoides vanveenii TaxID=330835 RepID=A0ABN2L5X7_9MICO